MGDVYDGQRLSLTIKTVATNGRSHKGQVFDAVEESGVILLFDEESRLALLNHDMNCAIALANIPDHEILNL